MLQIHKSTNPIILRTIWDGKGARTVPTGGSCVYRTVACPAKADVFKEYTRPAGAHRQLF